MTVTLGSGVSGTPEAGSHTYPELTKITYKYKADAGAVYPQVIINNSIQSAIEDTLTLYTNLVIEVKQTDLRDYWHVKIYDDDSELTNEWNMTLSGANEGGGTATVDDPSLQGTWKVYRDSMNQIAIQFPTWNGISLTRLVNVLSGTWTAGSEKGTWTTTRN